MVLPYDELGAGPAVMLLHAGICDRRMWNETLEVLAAAGQHAIAVDLPGYGDAGLDASRPYAPWEDVLATLDNLSIEQAALVGVSAGGGVGLRLAAAAPGRVSALCLVSARPYSDAPPSQELQSAFDAEVGPAEAGDLDGAVAGVLEHWLMPGAPTTLRDRVAAMERRSLEIQLAAGDPPDAPDPLAQRPDALEAVTVPALVCVGEHDLPDFHAAAAELARRLPGAVSPLLVIPGARHLAPLEAPDEFRARLLDFLTTTPARPPASTHEP
jgi:3-oxoadipate enol-lactonase